MGKEISDSKRIEEILNLNYHIFTYLADIGSSIFNINVIRERLDELDTVEPYDNGLNYTHVNRVELLSSREGNAAVLAMLIDNADIKRIVQIIAVENEKNKTKIIKPWSVNNVIF